MAPPPAATNVVAPVVGLAVRGLTFVCLVISLIILATNNITVDIIYTNTLTVDQAKLRFQDVIAYRYMLASIVIGIAYTLLQTAFTINEVSTGNRISGGYGLYYFDFYADKFMSYMLATGVGAGFGVTLDMKDTFGDLYSGDGFDKFFNKGAAASSILLLAFVFSAISSIFSSLSLPKRA